MKKKRIAVVGGGINGLALARQLFLDFPGMSITVFEKETKVALHQSSHNSGVVHAGLYYEPGSLKARLCIRGVKLLKEFCEEHELAYDECGKIVVALEPEEIPRLENIYRRSQANGVPGVELIDAEAIKDVEPHAVGIKALHSPKTAIVSYRAIAEKLAAVLTANGVQLKLGAEVWKIRETADAAYIEGYDGPLDDLPYDHVVTCAGLQSDRLAAASGDLNEPRIVPFFGLYYVVEPSFKDHVRGLIYPVPDPRYPFLGVHFTKRIDGEMTLGPNAFISLGREDYTGKKPAFRDIADFLTFPGFWKFAARNTAVTVRELKTVASTKSFVSQAAKYVPSMHNVKVVPATRGIRAQAMERNGQLVDDFVIRRRKRVTHIRNAPSPGATSSLAIAEYIVREVLDLQ